MTSPSPQARTAQQQKKNVIIVIHYVIWRVIPRKLLKPNFKSWWTLAVATDYNDRICCSVDVVGPSNLVTFLEHTSGYRQDLRRVEYGDERDPKMRDFLERIAPANNAKNITKPLFVIAGKNDPRVPVSESQQMVNIVRQNGTPVWWLMAKDEGHGFAKKKNQDYQFDATVMFVKEYLLK